MKISARRFAVTCITIFTVMLLFSNLDIFSYKIVHGHYNNMTSFKSNVQTCYPDRIKSNEFYSKIRLRPETARYLNTSHPVYIAKYILENPALCCSVLNISVLVIVHTSPRHFEMRNSIRHTWVNNTYFTSQSGVVKVLFLLGKSNESTIQRQLELEFERFKDLLQGDFIDSYYNLSLKGTMAYKWVTERCGNAKVIIKVDDDVVVNMVEILANINNFMKPRSVVCNLAVQAPIFRNETDKWFVPNSLFPSTQYYPNYCKGGFVSFSNDLIPELFKSATITPFFWIDDVYLYGLVLNNLLEITITSLVDTTDQYHSSVCRKRPVCPYLVVLLMEREPSEMQRVWSSMLRHSRV